MKGEQEAMGTGTALVIVDMGYPGEELAGQHGPFSDWFRRSLEPWSAGIDIHSLPVAEARLTDFDSAAGVIFTGAREGVYDPLPWRRSFDPIARALVENGTPVLGVCFGHQYLATVSGGRVEHAPRNGEEGLIRCHISESGQDDPLLYGLPKTADFLASHNDMVVEAPAGAVILAANERVPVQAFHLTGTNARGVQFHPEMTPAISRTIISQGYADRPRERDDLLATLASSHLGNLVMRNFLGICGLL